MSGKIRILVAEDHLVARVGVTTIVSAVVIVLSLMHLSRLAQVSLDESNARAELLSNAIFHRAREIVVSPPEAYQALKSDPGLRSILEHVLLDIMYDLPSLNNVEKVVVDEGMIKGDTQPILLYSDQPKVAGSA